MNAMIHFVCTGTCEGVSDDMKTCEAVECTQHGVPLTPCDCADNGHETAHTA